MNLPGFAVHRPITMTMIFVGILMVGALAFLRLPIDLMPDLETPAISVITIYPGASAEDVETKVTKEIEDRLSTVNNLDEINSTSKENISVVTALFEWETDLDEASNDIRDLLEFAKRRLPEDAEQPVLFKFNTSLFPVLVLGISTDESYAGLHHLVEKKIADALKRVPGVGAAQIIGGPERQIRIELDQVRLEAYGISFQQIAAALAANNVTIPAGSVEIGRMDYTVRVPGEFDDVRQIPQVVVGQHRGRLVHLRDVARVLDDFKEQTVRITVERKPGLILLVQKRSGANTVEVTDAVKAKLAELERRLPPDLEITEVMDGSVFIRQSVANLKEALIYGGVFVVLVVFVSLRRIRGSLIVALTIPFSLIAAFILLYLLDYTINMVSLMSLAIAVGMVVDDAIVILENVTRHVEQGEQPSEAAIFGASEVGLAVMASTLTTVAVFAPIMFATRMVGVMFRQLALVVIVTILASLFASLTLTPMLASRLLGREQRRRGIWQRIFAWSERGFAAVERGYGTLLGWAMTHRWMTVLAAVLIFGGSFFLLPSIGTEFFPEEDTGDIQVEAELAVGTRLEETQRVAKEIEQLFYDYVPEIVHTYIRTGQSEEGFATVMGQKEGPNIATIGAKLMEQSQRQRSSQEIAAVLRKKIQAMPEVVKLNIRAGNPMESMLLGGTKPLSVDIIGHDLAITNRLAARVSQILKRTPGTIDVQISRGADRPELRVVLDREKASSMGLNQALVGGTLRASIYGFEAAKYREGGDEYEIFLRLQEADRRTVSDVEAVTVPSLGRGGLVKVKNVSSVREQLTPLEIQRKEQERVVTVGAGVYGRPLGNVVADVRNELEKLEIPPDIDLTFSGQVEEQQKSFRDLALLLTLSVVLVYMVMASQFESLLDPFVIMFSVPFAFVGVVLFFFLTQTTLSIVSFIGAIILAGIVVKNGIVLVDYTNILRARGLELFEAVTTAGAHRLRPVLMTTTTTILGMLPMALSRGEGAEIWRPLGITVIGGLLVSTLVTLILVPVIYSIFESHVRRAIRV